jgi:hypothetical protein
MSASKMHAGELDIDAALVRRCLPRSSRSGRGCPSSGPVGSDRQRPVPARRGHGGAIAARRLDGHGLDKDLTWLPWCASRYGYTGRAAGQPRRPLVAIVPTGLAGEQ